MPGGGYGGQLGREDGPFCVVKTNLVGRTGSTAHSTKSNLKKVVPR